MKINQVQLRNSGRFPNLSTLKENFINSLLEEVESYFKETEFEHYQYFDPRNLPVDEFDVESHDSIHAIMTLAHKLNFPPTISDEWICVLKAMINSDKFTMLRTTKPIFFMDNFLPIKTYLGNRISKGLYMFCWSFQLVLQMPKEGSPY